MARAQVLLPDDPTYARDAKELVEAARALSGRYSSLVTEMISFAERFRSVSERAQKMDQADNGQRYDELCQQLTKAVRSSNPSIWSRWNTIAGQASQLRKYATALPPYRDSLYEVALSLNDKPSQVSKWVSDSELTPDTPVSKIKSLRAGKKKPAKTKSQRQSARKGFPAAVTLYFRDYEAIIEFLTSVMDDYPEFRISADKTLEGKFAALGEKEYAKAKKRFS